MRILIVEDDRKISSFIAEGLKQAGFGTDTAFDGEDGLAKAAAGEHVLIVMDLMLPKLDGLAVIERLRAAGKDTPVLILSAKRAVDDRVRGLKAGGDDYLTKPFSFSELLARVQALIRRACGGAEPSCLDSSGVTVDLLSREVRRDGKKLELQAREFELLCCLMRNAGRPVSKTVLLEEIWGYDFDPQTNVVDVLVFRLRDKLDKPFGEKLLQTIRGVGYVFRKL